MARAGRLAIAGFERRDDVLMLVASGQGDGGEARSGCGGRGRDWRARVSTAGLDLGSRARRAGSRGIRDRADGSRAGRRRPRPLPAGSEIALEGRQGAPDRCDRARVRTASASSARRRNMFSRDIGEADERDGGAALRLDLDQALGLQAAPAPRRPESAKRRASRTSPVLSSTAPGGSSKATMASRRRPRRRARSCRRARSRPSGSRKS